MKEQYRKSGADYIFAVCLVVFGVAYSYAALKMQVFNNSLMVSPGLFPLILGVVFIVLGFALFVSSTRREGKNEARRILTVDNIKEFTSSPRVRKGGVLLLIMLIYVLCVGKIPFVWITAGYLFITFIYLKAMKWHWCFFLSLTTAFIINFAFRNLFRIPMP